MKKCLVALILIIQTILHPNSCRAQLKKQFLTIGDTCPDIQLSMVNYTSPNARISDFRGKAVILDFWGTWCAPCVASLPKLEAIQNEFGDKLLILPVTDEDKSKVQSFLNKVSNVKVIKPISVVNDKDLNRAFSHMTVPFYVWVDKNGLIKALTYPESINERNIKDLINGRNINAPVRNDYSAITSYPTNSLFSLVNKDNSLGDLLKKDSNIVSCHILAKCIPNSSGGGSWDKGNIVMSNSSILALFQIAYGEGMKFFGGWSKVKLITKDSTKFTDGSNGGRLSVEYRKMWRILPRHEYNYVLKLPIDDSIGKWQIMRNDLGEYFPFVSAHIEKEERLCLVLQQTGNEVGFRSKDTGKAFIQRSPFFIICNRLPMESFLMTLKLAYQDEDVLDETGYKGNIDIHLEVPLQDIEAVNRILRTYGLVLKREYRNVDILVVKDLR